MIDEKDVFDEIKDIKLDDAFNLLDEDDREIMAHVEKIKNTIAQDKGIMSPEATTRALAIMSNYFSVMSEKAMKYKAMRNEYYGYLLTNNLPIGRAKGIAEGSEYGKKRVLYQGLADGYLEIMNALKKVQEYHNNVLKNQY